MKKTALTMAIAMLFALASCQKEKAVTKTVIDTPPPAAKTIKVSSNFDYVELTPISRQPGENFDSYVANFHGCYIKLQGPGSYNFEKYPNLVDGVPVTYPLPQPAPPTPTPILNKGFFITDSENPTIAYYIDGVRGNLVSADKVTVVNNTFDFTNSVKVLVNGSYTHVINTGTFHYWGAIKRLDGSLFSFDITEDTN